MTFQRVLGAVAVDLRILEGGWLGRAHRDVRESLFERSVGTWSICGAQPPDSCFCQEDVLCSVQLAISVSKFGRAWTVRRISCRRVQRSPRMASIHGDDFVDSVPATHLKDLKNAICDKYKGQGQSNLGARNRGRQVGRGAGQDHLVKGAWCGCRGRPETR